MKRQIGLVVVSLIAVMLVAGCFGSKERTQILSSVDQIKSEQQTMRKDQEVMLKNQQESMQTGNRIQSGVDRLLKSSEKSIGMEQNILSLVSDTNAKVTAGNEKMGRTLESVYREVYGLGFDLRAAIGETRMVVEVNNRLPLKVHAEIPKDEMAFEPVAKLPVGALIFQCQKVNDTWWKGVIIREGEKETVYFAVKYTQPIREALSPESINMEGGTGTE